MEKEFQACEVSNKKSGDGRQSPVSAIIVGAGHRSLGYASYALYNEDKLKIVGVVEPNDFRRKETSRMFNIPEEYCYKSVGELAAKPRIADAAINGTMDKEHVQTSIPLLMAGYHLLLEKPISTNEEDLLKLHKIAKDTGRTVMICHVLRYAPFYAEIKKRIAEGVIGEIINIQTSEHVSYHHMSVSHIRGKWNNKSICKSSMLMAKCCHDLDIITWMKSGIRPVKVGSFGSLMQFRQEKLPEGAGSRCLVDCPIEEECLYSARKLYIDHPERWNFYVWSYIENLVTPKLEDKIESLKKDNPHGRCAWRCDNNVVDHQSVIIQFEDGSTATHNMVGGTSKPCRKIHIIGTKGEIEGVMEEGIFTIRHPDTKPGCEYKEEKVKLDVSKDPHGGGDVLFVEDFIRVMRGELPSISTTNLEDSIYGHLIGFGADMAMEEEKVVKIDL